MLVTNRTRIIIESPPETLLELVVDETKNIHLGTFGQLSIINWSTITEKGKRIRMEKKLTPEKNIYFFRPARNNLHVQYRPVLTFSTLILIEKPNQHLFLLKKRDFFHCFLIVAIYRRGKMLKLLLACRILHLFLSWNSIMVIILIYAWRKHVEKLSKMAFFYKHKKKNLALT